MGINLKKRDLVRGRVGKETSVCFFFLFFFFLGGGEVGGGVSGEDVNSTKTVLPFSSSPPSPLPSLLSVPHQSFPSPPPKF